MLDNRPTFEEAYKNVIMNSELYKLKAYENQSSRLMNEAADHDIQTYNELMETLCEDVSFLLNRKFKHIKKLKLGRLSLSGCLGEYNYHISRISESINSLISDGFFDDFNDCRPKIGWIKWNGNVADVHRRSLPKISLEDPEMVTTEGEKPQHIQKMLLKFEKTKFNYQPYFLKGSNETVLAIRLGHSWKDVALDTFKKYKSNSFPKMDCRVVGFFLGLIINIFCFLIDNLDVNGLPFIISISVIAISAAMAFISSMSIYHLFFRTIEV